MARLYAVAARKAAEEKGIARTWRDKRKHKPGSAPHQCPIKGITYRETKNGIQVLATWTNHLGKRETTSYAANLHGGKEEATRLAVHARTKALVLGRAARGVQVGVRK